MAGAAAYGAAQLWAGPQAITAGGATFSPSGAGGGGGAAEELASLGPEDAGEAVPGIGNVIAAVDAVRFNAQIDARQRTQRIGLKPAGNANVGTNGGVPGRGAVAPDALAPRGETPRDVLPATPNLPPRDKTTERFRRDGGPLRFRRNARGELPYQRIPDDIRNRLQPLFDPYHFNLEDVWVVVRPLGPDVPGAHVRGNVIFLDPSVLNSPRLQASTIAHEVVHPLQERILGEQGLDARLARDMKRWSTTTQLYLVPSWLAQTPIESVNILGVGPSGSIDASTEQVAQRFYREVFYMTW